jgi:hypothetical protein
MDKIYLVVYALIVLTLIRAIFAYKATTDADANVVKQVYATDKKLLVAGLLTFVVATSAIVLLR